MIRPLGLAAALLLGACAGLIVEPPADCAGACAVAYDCGFLPGALGHGDSPETARDDCLRLCNQSPADDPTVAALVACTAATGDTGWCADEAADNYAAGLQCAATVECINAARLGGDALLGDVDLDISLITLDDFVLNFDLATLTGLYREPTTTRTCAAALCGDETCTRTDDDAAAAPCDATMCGKGMFQIGKTCEDLAATAIEVITYQAGAPQASQVLLDDTASDCKVSRALFTSDVYRLRPGPVRALARVSGTLPAGELKRIDYPIPDEVMNDADLVDYCLAFLGMHVQARSGDTRALVPIGDIDAILNHLPDPDLRPVPCSEGK